MRDIFSNGFSYLSGFYPIRIGKLLIAVFVAASLSLAARGQNTLPMVAIHDSELTRAMEAQVASNGTPSNPANSSGFQWWVTNFHYFVMPEMLKESMRSDGTPFTTVGDSNITAGALLTNGQPRYPILISLASEAIRDDEIGPLTNYVAAGGVLFVGSSAFTRNTNGTTRTDFAIANQMGVHMVNTVLTNWNFNNTLTKQINHRIVSHIPSGVLTWAVPYSAEDNSWGVTPFHQNMPAHLVWQVTAGDATVVTMGDTYPSLLVKPYGKGYFIYCAAMEPLLGHGGWAPGMYAYMMFRKSIEWAFENSKVPVSKISPWPYPYDAAFMVRHDLENIGDEILHVSDSAQYEAAHGAKGEYYFCTGTLREDMVGTSNAAISGLRLAATNYGALINSHNGGLVNPVNTNTPRTNLDYWHWGPDEAMSITNSILGYANGKAYALASLSNSFLDIEGWLSGIATNTMRSWVAPYFNATREDSVDIQSQLGVKTTGDNKLSFFPSWVFSTRTAGLKYGILNIPVSDWFVGSQVIQVAQSIEAGHTTPSILAAVDFYYNSGGLINLYSHTLTSTTSTNGPGPSGTLPRDYVNYVTDTTLHPRGWAVNSTNLYNWWLQRSNMSMTVTTTSGAGGVSTTTMSISGSSDTNAAVELVLPSFGALSALQVQTNGVSANTNAYRTNSQVLKVRVGTSVTNVVVTYTLIPKAISDYYSINTGNQLNVPAPGVLANDSAGLGTNNLTTVVATNPPNGVLNLSNNGSFTYTANTNFTGSDSFTYRANDGLTNSAPATVTISVVPAGSVFFDDFTRAAGADPLVPWQVPTGLGTWSITNGVLQGASFQQQYGYAYISNSWTDYSVQASVQFPAGAFGGGIGGRLNPVTGTHYGAWIYPEGSPGGSHVLKLIKYQSWSTWSGNPMQQVTLAAVGTNAHLLKASFQSNQITVSFDGTNMISVTDNNFDGMGAYSSGGITADMWTFNTPYNISIDNVLVSLLNTGPVANNDSYNVVQGQTLNVPVSGVLSNDAGGSGPLTAVLVGSPSHGILNLNTNGSFSYTPTNAYVGVDSFTYQATDGVTNSSAAAVTITVTTAPPPVANNDTYVFALNTPLNVSAPGVLANDTDPNGSNLTAVLVSGPTYGQVTLNSNGSFLYTPATNFIGVDTFTYRAFDGLNNSSPATVTLSDPVAGVLFSDNFTRPNDPTNLTSPWAVHSNGWSVTGGTLQGGPNGLFSYGDVYVTNNWSNYFVQARVQFQTNAFGGGIGGRLQDPSGGRYVAWIYPEGSSSGLSSVMRLIKYQDWTTWGYQGSSFTPIAQANLSSVGTNFHTVKLAFHSNRIAVYYDGQQVITAPDAEASPYLGGGISVDMWTDSSSYVMTVDDVLVGTLALDNSYTATGSNTLTVVATNGVLTNDTGVYSTNITSTVATGVANGTLTLNTNGSFTYRATNFTGSDSFIYQLNDTGTNLGTATVNITVNPVHNGPSLPAQSTRTNSELTTLTVTNTATDSDFPAFSLNYSLTVAPTNASISTNGIITWTPTEAQGPSTNTFTTVVSDTGSPVKSATNTFSVVVTEVNVAPTLPAQTNRTIAELTLLTVTNTASDTDIPANVLSYVLTVGPTNASISTNGIITWTPSESQGPGTNTFTTVVTDNGSPAKSATNSFTVTVTEVNSAPVLPAQTNRTITELALMTVTNTATDSDIPSNVLSYVLTVAPTNASISTNGIITWTPTEAQGPSTNTFTTVVTDNGSPNLSATNTFTVTVNETNAAPVLPAQTNVTINELTLLTVTNTATDSDIPANTLSYALTVAPTNASISTNGIITWTPSEAQGPSTNTFTTVVTDNGTPARSATNSFTVTVNEVNTAPSLPAQTNVTINELTLLTVTNTASDSDIPSNVLSYVLTVGPTNASISTNGIITWTPNESQGPGTNTFTTVVTDNGTPPMSATNTFTVTVNEVNSAPTLPAQTNINIGENSSMTITNTATDSDIPTNTLSYALTVAPTNAAISSNGIITWAPTSDQSPSTNTFTTVVTDDGVPPLSATNTFTVTVSDVNTPPTLPVQTNFTINELTLMTVTNTATDSDLPANILSYALVVAPTNASISTNGIITWTPNESQGPGSNVFTTVVTDNGTPPMSATNTFTVTVNEVNTAPVLPSQTNVTISEFALLTITNTATDSDIPVNTLSYVLTVAPTNAAISTNGVITWTPNELQGPSTNTFTTVVTDNGVPPMSATNTFIVTVTEVNSPPALPVQTNLTVDELTLMTVTNTATDPDVPANLLSYVLTVGPTNATISTNGIITWTPNEAQGPGTNVFTTVVTDNGIPPMSATNTFTVTVNEVNSAPVLPPQSNLNVSENSSMTVTNTATDSDVPTNTLSYVLTAGPTNASISTNGIITWTPTSEQGATTNTFTTVVTDNGVPPMSATNTFTVTVSDVNTAPTLPVQTNFAINELTLMTVTNTATDSDLPANTLSYVLTVGPTNASISTNGIITWTPTEAQGPGTNIFTTVVTDNGTPPMSATNTFTVTVNEVNTAPVLPVQTNVTINELTLMTVTNTATDSDIPSNTLSYVLTVGPTNAVISTNGIITWTPTEAEGPGTNIFTTVVTDNGTPPMSATNTFTVTVNEVNTAPVLPVQTNVTINELTLMTVTNTATDSDIPSNTLSYVLTVGPTNAVISTNGIITWTPTEAQGPGTNIFTTVVTDNGSPVMSATNTFTVVVNEVNAAPVLPVQTNVTINELTLLTVTNTATDSDIPSNTLSYVLTVAPTNATISSNGIITWTPTEEQGPSTNTFTTVVTDNGTPPMSATNTFTVTVNEVNTAPVLPSQTNLTIDVGITMTVTNAATDADIPANVLSYVLAAGPTNAVISTNGVITWTPDGSQGGSSNIFTTVVTDNGVPALSATNSFTVVVNVSAPAPMITSITMANSVATVTWTSVAGHDYRLQYRDGPGQTNWVDITPDVSATNTTSSMTNAVGTMPERYYRVFLVH